MDAGVADSTTLFTIFNMLNENSTIQSMSLEHVQCPFSTGFSLFNKELQHLQTLTSAILTKGMVRKFFKKQTRRPQVFYYDIDMEKIAELKDENDVSTNEIMHYWLSTLIED